MGAGNHNKGHKLAAGQFLTTGDFLISPNGLFVGVLEPNGSFAIYWNQLDQVGGVQTAFAGQPAAHIWHSPGDNPGPHFMVMQTDGNLCIYRGGGFQNNDGATWASDSNRPGGGPYAATLSDDGMLRVMSGAQEIWKSEAGVVMGDEVVCVSGINYGAEKAPTFALSAKPPTGMGSPSQGPASATTLGAAPTDDQVWRRYYWWALDTETIGHPRRERGTVLINKQTGLALGSDGAGKTVMTPFVDDNAAWGQGDPEYRTSAKHALAALRLFRDTRFNLNVKGDAPYASGTEVLLWSWSGAQPNLVWRLDRVESPAPVPA
jgi:hypothetical protein